MRRRLPAALVTSLSLALLASPAHAQSQGSTADFTFSPATPKVGEVVEFTDASSGFIFGWFWNFGDGETSGDQNPTHVYGQAGVFSVTLTVVDRNLNQLSATKSVSVTAGGTADFRFDPVSPTVGQTVTFTDLSAGGATAWAWDFGDGGSSSQQNPAHAYASAGTKNVKLTVTAGGTQSSAVKSISVKASSLNADFAFFPTNPVTSQAVSFEDTSKGSPTGWSWTFGDGATSTQQNPTHTYTTANTFTVVLTVSGGGGASNSETKHITVTAAPTGSFTARVARMNEINGDTTNGNGTSEPGERSTLNVSVSNGTSRTQPNVVGLIVPKTPGITMIVDQVEYGSVAAGASAVAPGVPFEFYADPSVPCATTLSFDLRLSYGGQAAVSIPLTQKLGSNPCAPPKDSAPGVTLEDATMAGTAYSVGSGIAVYFVGRGSKSITSYKIELSRDGGASFNETVSDSEAYVGPHVAAFTATGPDTTRARLRITAKVSDGTTVTAESRNDFTITSSASGAGVARLPVVVQTAGQQGTFFTTEATIASPDRAAAVSLTFTPIGQLPIALPKPIAILRGTRFLPDVFQPFRDQGVFSANLGPSLVGTLTATVGGVPKPVILARVVNLPSTGIGTFGLSFLSTTEGAAFSSEAWVSGLVTNGQFRSNISVAHVGGGSRGPLGLALELYDGATGQQVSGSPLPIVLAPNGFLQINNFQGFGVTSTGLYLARVVRTSGDDQFRAYGTIIDAITGDSSFVDGSSPNANGSAAVKLASVVEAAGQFGSFFTSDVTLVNRSATQTAKVSLHLDTNQGSFDVPNAFTLGPRQAQVVSGVVRYFDDHGARLTGTVVGPLTATFSAGDGYASVRTSSAQRNQDPATGTYGLSFAGRRDSDEATSSVVLVGAKKSTSYRTNLSLVNVGDKPITLSYVLVTSAYYKVSKTVDIALAPGAFAQVNDVVGSTPQSGAAGGGGSPGDYFVLVTRTAGSTPWEAYLTILDNVTNDGSFVEMVKR